MYIYIKTPPINDSNQIAHLVEHCVINKKNINNQTFFNICDTKGETYQGYTRFKIENLDINKFINYIENGIEKDVFKIEKKALKEELQGIGYTNKLKNIIEKYLGIEKIKELITYDNIEKYHKEYYNNKNYVITNNDYELVKNNLDVKPSKKRWDLEILGKFDKKIMGEKSKIYILKYANRQDQVFSNFIETLIDTYIEYEHRFKSGKYNFPCTSMIEGESYIGIAIPTEIKILISDEFIENCKNYYIKMIKNGFAKENKIINLMYLNQLPELEEMILFIKNCRFYFKCTHSLRKLIGVE